MFIHSMKVARFYQTCNLISWALLTVHALGKQVAKCNDYVQMTTTRTHPVTPVGQVLHMFSPSPHVLYMSPPPPKVHIHIPAVRLLMQYIVEKPSTGPLYREILLKRKWFKATARSRWKKMADLVRMTRWIRRILLSHHFPLQGSGKDPQLDMSVFSKS